ncbi:hypothetical protein [Kribbella sp. C-35]|uniref:hypothetical protein n=1 Tax=Kribbella sp. C-35 TaxID=2789276 RepID=UPI00397A083A
MRLRRTYYGVLDTGPVRGGSTQRGESLTDVDGYLLPMERTTLGALLEPGVADGLQVSAVQGQPGLTIAPGVAVDGLGRVAALVVDGTAVIDQTLPADQQTNVPMVDVTVDGVALPTDGSSGDFVLSIVPREVWVTANLGQVPEIDHAPWLHLEPAAAWTENEHSVALATVMLDANGAVTALVADRRRLALAVTDTVTRHPTAASGISALTVGQAIGSRPRSLPDGSLELERTAPDGTVSAGLTVDGPTGQVRVADGLTVAGDLDVAGTVVVAGTFETTGGLDVAGKLVVEPSGDVAIGLGSAVPSRVLHVEGSEVHSGGTGGGFSFADRQAGAFVESPAAGQRWVWYAAGGTARLWSGTDQLTVGAPAEGGGLDVARRMRVRQGGDASAGIWLHQNGSGDAAFLGMSDDRHAGIWGRGAGFALVMDVGDGRVSARGPLDVGAGGRADLRVTGDVYVGAGGNGVLTARHVNGKAVGSDGADDLFLNWATGRSVHVGGAAAATFAVHGDGVVDGNLRVRGAPAVPAWSGGGVVTFDLFSTGGIYVGQDVDNPRTAIYANGTKAFVIDHPLDPENRTLQHVCIEGPEAAVFYRGSGRLVDGRAEVVLPEYFEALVLPEERTVMLTALCDDDEAVAVLAASPVRRGRFTVRAADGRNPSQRFWWEVKGVRADVEPLAVVTEKSGRTLVAAG